MVMGSIHTRIREVGLLKVVGASRWQLLRLFLYEAVIIGAIGGVVGYLAGHALARVVGPWLVSGAVIEPQWYYPVLAVVAATLASVLASLYPAWYVARIRAAEAFRAL
jgi:putative ABC transport system permease protein